MEFGQRLKRTLDAAFEYRRGRQKRKPPEEVETPEEGAEKLFLEVVGLILSPETTKEKTEAIESQHIIYQMGLRRMGVIMDKNLCFVDEFMPDKGVRIGVMSNSVHIQMYSMPEGSIEPPDFSSDVTPVLETDINMGIAVARWLKRPYIELGKHRS